MKLKTFENDVDDKILERGHSYFKNDCIEDIERVGKYEFSCTIVGTEEYDVYLRLNSKKEIIEHSCSCPYDWGNICKHEIAMMYYVREEKLYNQPMEESLIYKIETDLKEMNKKELIELVLELGKRNKKMKEQILWELGYEIE